MKLSAPRLTEQSSALSLSSRKKSGWLRTVFLQASCLSQSVATAGALGVDFFDPSAVRRANCNVLKTVADTPCA